MSVQFRFRPAVPGAFARLRAVAADLASSLSFGADQPERFVSAWYGPPTRRPVVPPGSVPDPLRRWHELASRWERPLLRQNRIPARRQMDGGLLLIGREAQDVWLWGLDQEGSVSERENHGDAIWTRTGEDFDEFLWHFVLIDAIFGGSAVGTGATMVSAEQVSLLAATWDPVPIKPWRWPGPDHRLWHRAGVLAWAFANEPSSETDNVRSFGVLTAARTVDDLAALEQLGITWDYTAR